MRGVIEQIVSSPVKERRKQEEGSWKGYKNFPQSAKSNFKKNLRSTLFLVYFSLHLFFEKEWNNIWPKTMTFLEGLDAKQKDSFIMFNSLELFLFVWETAESVSRFSFGHHSF